MFEKYLLQLSQLRDREIPRLEAVKGQKEAEIKKLQTELKRVGFTYLVELVHIHVC